MFNYLHPDHYAMFLYLLANTVSRGDRANPLPFRLFYLNKVLHGLDVYHDTELPEVFQFMHPLGTVLGQAGRSLYRGPQVRQTHRIARQGHQLRARDLRRRISRQSVYGG